MYYSGTYTVEVDIDRGIYAQDEMLSLLMNTTLTGNSNHVGTSVTPKLYSTSQMLEDINFEVPQEKISWESADETIVKVLNGALVSVNSGDTYVTASTEYGDIELPVRVSYPIYSAEDLDFLSKVSYTEDKAKAQKYMDYNYIFMNDIDYASHTRNYILPIASFNHGYNFSVQEGTQWKNIVHLGKNDAHTSYFSFAWKEILGLTEGGNDTDGRYLTNADGSKFTGVNPNSIWFTGRLDGNGYAIKNAWYMWDNYFGTTGGNVLFAVAGSFVGLNRGVIENIEMDVKTPNNFVVENNGKYTQGGKTENNANKTLGRIYNGKNLLCVDGTTARGMTANYGTNSGNIQVKASESAFVMINSNTVQNIYYSVTVNGTHNGNAATNVSGGFVLVNTANIKDSVVNRYIENNEYNHIANYNYALVGMNKPSSYKVQCPNGVWINAENYGGNITGCYTLVSSTTEYKKLTTHASQEFTIDNMRVAYCKADADTAETDATSKKVYATLYKGDSNNPYAYFTAEWADMIADAKTNGNLKENVWAIDNTANTVGLKNGIVSF